MAKDKDTKLPQPRYSGSLIIRAIARMQEQCQDFDDQVAEGLEQGLNLRETMEAIEAHEACGDK
jgi:hypothetical protein|tara:strand:- start:342 stop:533 length:192 start_codon:yes stop_codon:yes gene_type:complete